MIKMNGTPYISVFDYASLEPDDQELIIELIWYLRLTPIEKRQKKQKNILKKLKKEINLNE